MNKNFDAITSLNDQQVQKTNQISNKKPDIIKNANVLTGYIGNSQNGGILKPIAYLPVMAGTKIMDYRIRLNLKMLTPKTPNYQKLKAVIKCYFVPNSAVWTNSEKFIAQKGGMTTTKIKEIPNTGGKTLSFLELETPNEEIGKINMVDTDLWRDSWISTYLPKYQTGLTNPNGFTELPKNQILAIRGFKKIWNDYERNKEYDTPFDEFKGDTVTSSEWQSIVGTFDDTNEYTKLVKRGKRQTSYYTDYRTELLGEDTNGTEPLYQGDGQVLLNWTEWEKTVAELRSESENAQMNDWEILSKIRGSKKLTQGKPQLLSVNVVGLNYTSVPQTTYNTNGEIQEQYQVLGQEGAYSYTETELSLIKMHEIIEEGYIHVTMQITADSVFESGFDRTNLNVGIFDIYRPDLIEQKEDVLYEIEKCGTRLNSQEDLTKVTGYKRKFSEYFKLPNAIAGEMTTGGYYKTKMSVFGNEPPKVTDELTRYESQQSFQCFEIDDKETPTFLHKDIWKDYTDILLNENLAIKEEVEEIKGFDDMGFKTIDLRVHGQNQIFYLGKHTLIADLPINENIKSNYTKWGEK